MPKIVLDLKDRRPAWALPEWVVQEIRSALPKGWTLQEMEGETDGSGDGSTDATPELLDAIRDAEIYLGYGMPPRVLEAARALRWAHSGAAGVGSLLSRAMVESPVVLTNSKGIHGPPMAETVLAMILFFSRGLDFARANQERARWDTDPFYAGDHPLTEISSSTIGLFGYGGIGRQVARRARVLGARILAFDRSSQAFQDKSRVSLGPEVDPGDSGFTALFGPDGFHRLLEESDFLVLTAPDTAETRGKVDREALGRMKAGAVLINVSRGCIVVDQDLVEALRSGRLRGAGLDVFSQEPLPSSHPLWSFSNVILTPHVSGVSRGFWRRQTDLILENLRRYQAGEELLNVVDKESGF